MGGIGRNIYLPPCLCVCLLKIISAVWSFIWRALKWFKISGRKVFVQKQFPLMLTDLHLHLVTIHLPEPWLPGCPEQHFPLPLNPSGWQFSTVSIHLVHTVAVPVFMILWVFLQIQFGSSWGKFKNSVLKILPVSFYYTSGTMIDMAWSWKSQVHPLKLRMEAMWEGALCKKIHGECMLVKARCALWMNPSLHTCMQTPTHKKKTGFCKHQKAMVVRLRIPSSS